MVGLIFLGALLSSGDETNGDATTAPTTTLVGATTTTAGATTTTDDDTTSTTAAPTTTTSVVGSIGIGDSVENSSLRFTLELVSYPETDALDLEPEPGMRYIVFEGVVETLSGDDEPVSSLLMFEARTPDGRSWDQDIFVADPSLDGDALPGLPIRGGVGFQIPEDEQIVFLIVSLDPFFGGVDGVYEVEVTP